MEQVQELESAILQRANRLAVEYRERAERSRDNILQEAHKRLHLREEREVLLAKSKAERTFRRQVQANELKLQKEMDHLRWNLVTTVRNQLGDRLRQLADDEARYLPLLKSLLISAAGQFTETRLLASVNARDLGRLQPGWPEFAAAVENREVILSNTPIETAGGIVVSNEAGDIRINNSFEGREERLVERINQIILERLFPATSLQNNLGGMR
ncbi:MAG: V-type ATP synthase subunit E family protein [Sedimenticola sp.]|nr:V-type ATP synthase subunit E family protein [Sedimenticola sp.]